MSLYTEGPLRVATVPAELDGEQVEQVVLVGPVEQVVAVTGSATDPASLADAKLFAVAASLARVAAAYLDQHDSAIREVCPGEACECDTCAETRVLLAQAEALQ